MASVTNSNAQSHKPYDELPGHKVGAITRSCYFSGPSSSPTTVSDRIIEEEAI